MAEEKLNQPDDGDDVEAHKYELEEVELDKLQTPTDDGDDEVEAHKF